MYGLYVNGYVKIQMSNGSTLCKRYDETTDDLIDDKVFDAKIDTYKRTLDYLRLPFYKTVVWDEKLLLRRLYGSYSEWNIAVSHMLKLGILTSNRGLLSRGVI